MSPEAHRLDSHWPVLPQEPASLGHSHVSFLRRCHTSTPANPVSGCQQFYWATGSPDHGGDSRPREGEKGHPGCHLGSRCPLLAPVSSAGPFPVCPAHPASIANWALRFYPIFVANGSAAIDLRKGASRSSTALWCLMVTETSLPAPPPLTCLHKSPPHYPPAPPHCSAIPLGLPFPTPTSLALSSSTLCPLSSGPSRRKKEYPLGPPHPRETTSPFCSHPAGRRSLLVGSLRGGGGGAIHGPALTLASGSHLQTLHPSLTWEGRLCPRPWLLERPLPQMPPHRALGEGREVLKMAPGGPGGQGQLLAKAVDPGLDTAYPWACGAPSCPASSLGKLDSLPRRNRQGECY